MKIHNHKHKHKQINQIGLVAVSAEKDSIGTILTVNEAASAMFGRVRSELVGSNISTIIPEPFSVGDTHDQYLLKYASTGKTTVMNT